MVKTTQKLLYSVSGFYWYWCGISVNWVNLCVSCELVIEVKKNESFPFLFYLFFFFEEKWFLSISIRLKKNPHP